MKNILIESKIRCPNCGSLKNQIKSGLNRSGTQRYLCKNCGVKYTPDPKEHEFSDDIKEIAIKMFNSGISGRNIGKFFSMSKSNVHNWIKKNNL